MTKKSRLVRTIINGRPATVGYLTDIGGDMVPPEQAKVALIRFDDGDHAIVFLDHEPGSSELPKEG
jgi:hypothetical protein